MLAVDIMPVMTFFPNGRFPVSGMMAVIGTAFFRIHLVDGGSIFLVMLASLVVMIPLGVSGVLGIPLS
jgi:hypothetical protein